ncbi:MAG: hypothetical protein AUK64_2043 [bacterium P201]|nr:MAG: hypothetical protein AUK64_2043 [bacterium P201]
MLAIIFLKNAKLRIELLMNTLTYSLFSDLIWNNCLFRIFGMNLQVQYCNPLAIRLQLALKCIRLHI